MDPTIVTNLANALKAFFENAETNFGPGVNVYCRQDSLEVASAGVESDVHVQVVKVDLVTGEQTILVPPPPTGQASLGVPPELEGSLRIGINS